MKISVLAAALSFSLSGMAIAEDVHKLDLSLSVIASTKLACLTIAPPR